LAAFRSLEAFAQLGTDLDAATQSQLDRGYRMVELLKQPQYRPMKVTDQVLSLFAGTRGYLDDVPVKAVQQWERDFLQFVHSKYNSLIDDLNSKQDLTDQIVEQIIAAIKDFKTGYKPEADVI
jgi:F-type H+/Na+-transporting ATPase subunit alpha